MGEKIFTIKREVLGRPSVVNNDFVQSVDQEICERRRFIISEHLCEFPQILRIFLYKMITVRIRYHKFCARWVPKVSTGAEKTQRMASVLSFSERYHEVGDEFSITFYE
jgi:oligoribonuclease (3'-5' exoribonuclease)